MKKKSLKYILLLVMFCLIGVSCKQNSNQSNNSDSVISTQPSNSESESNTVQPSPSIEVSQTSTVSSSTFYYDPGEMLGTYYNPLGYNLTGDNLEITFLEMVDQYGDSIYIKSNDFDMIIDAGNAGDYNNFINFVENNISEDKKLELLVATHAHSDHIYGFRDDFLNIVTEVDYIIDYGYSYSTSIHGEYTRTRKKYVDAGTKYCPVTESVKDSHPCTKRVYIAPDFYIDILQTNNYKDKNYSFSSSDGQNEASVTFILTFKDTSFFFGGDITSAVERETILDTDMKQVTLAKSSHHGSGGSNSNNIYNALKPNYIVVSAAYTPQLIHPNSNAVSRMLNTNAKLYVNFTTGDLKFVSDGSNIVSVTGSPTKLGYTYNNAKVTGEENKEFKDTIMYKNFY